MIPQNLFIQNPKTDPEHQSTAAIPKTKSQKEKRAAFRAVSTRQNPPEHSQTTPPTKVTSPHPSDKKRRCKTLRAERYKNAQLRWTFLRCSVANKNKTTPKSTRALAKRPGSIRRGGLPRDKNNNHNHSSQKLCGVTNTTPPTPCLGVSARQLPGRDG